MAVIQIRSCSSKLDCPCIKCKNKKNEFELNRYKVQNTQMAVPCVLKQLSKTEWKTAIQLKDETNIAQPVISKALKWLVNNEPNLLVDKQYEGKDGRLVKVYSLK